MSATTPPALSSSETDLQAIAHLEESVRPSCDCRRHLRGEVIPCDQPAAWVMACVTCGCAALTCTPCRTELETRDEIRTCILCRQRALVVTGWAFQTLKLS